MTGSGAPALAVVRSLLGPLGRAAVTVGFVLLLNFFLFRALPGDPARASVRDPRIGPEVQELLRRRFGLDRPVANGITSLRPLAFGSWTADPRDTQLGHYLRQVAALDLGVSFQTGEPVRAVLGERLGPTVLLVLPAQILAIVLGTALGFAVAWRSGGRFDAGAVAGALVFWSLPTFWLGLLFLYWGGGLGLPVSGMATPGPDPGLWSRGLDVGRHMLLPTLTQTLVYLAEYVVLARSAVLEVLSEDYILTARARGLTPRQVLWHHAARNAALPLVTLTTLNLGFTVSGAIQVETVFSWPGLGLATFEAVLRRDYPLLQGVFLLVTVAVVFANLAADALYALLDPRLRRPAHPGQGGSV